MMQGLAVALLAEGVGRNCAVTGRMGTPSASPSSRRAWVEILGGLFSSLSSNRRPPRGGRG